MSTKRLTLAAFFMALMIILSSSVFSIPVPGGHFYFNTILIFLVTLYFQPMEVVIIAGLGSFLGDFFFYPAPMFVTLVTHSLQVLVIALILKNSRAPFLKTKVIAAFILGGIIDLLGYFLGRSFVYSTPAYAILKLPFDGFAVILGAVVAYFIYYHTPFSKMMEKALKD